VLAMFNKAIRKISIALNATLEDHEKSSMLGGTERLKVESAVDKMRNVAHVSLEEDAKNNAKAAMKQLSSVEKELPPLLAKDDDIMQYAIKGTDTQWSAALKERDVTDGSSGVVSIPNLRNAKRKLEEKDILQEGQLNSNKKQLQSQPESKRKGKKKNNKK
jgi:hypothetical protein